MESDWANILGLIGVVIILIAYFLLQFGRMSPRTIVYSLCNLVGAIMILVSLCVHWNLASVVIEIAWIAISLYGLIKAIKRWRRFKPRSEDAA